MKNHKLKAQNPRKELKHPIFLKETRRSKDHIIISFPPLQNSFVIHPRIIDFHSNQFFNH